MVKSILNISLAMKILKLDFLESKFMSLLMKHDELLEKYIEVWEKVKNSIQKEFDIKPV